MISIYKQASGSVCCYNIHIIYILYYIGFMISSISIKNLCMIKIFYKYMSHTNPYNFSPLIFAALNLLKILVTSF